MGWPKSLLFFSHEIKDTFFIFTSTFIDLDILSMSAISRVVQQWLFSMSRFDRCQLQLVYMTVEHRPARNRQYETLQTTVDIFNQSQHLLHNTAQISFCVSVGILPVLK